MTIKSVYESVSPASAGITFQYGEQHNTLMTACNHSVYFRHSTWMCFPGFIHKCQELIKIISANLLLLDHSIFNVSSMWGTDFWRLIRWSRVLCVWDLSPQQSFQVVEDEWVLHVHLSSITFESHTGIQLPLQFLPHGWWGPTQEVVLKRAACLRQVWLHRLLLAPFLCHVAWRPAVHPIHTVSICLAPQRSHCASELSLRNDCSGAGQTEFMAVSVTKVCCSKVADEEASVGAVEDVLH